MIDQLLKEISKLQEARRLLEKVWLECGPYNQDKIPDKTLREINDYFEFDDSE